MQRSLLCLSLALLHLSVTARADGVGGQGKYQDHLQERELGGPLWTSPIVVLGDYGVGKNVQQGGHGYQTSSAMANINGNGNTVTQDKSQQQVSGYNTSQVQDSQAGPAEGGPDRNAAPSWGTVSGNAAPPPLVQGYNQAGGAGNMAQNGGQPIDTSMGGTAAQALPPARSSSGTSGTNPSTQSPQFQTGQRTGYPSGSPIRGQALGQDRVGAKPNPAGEALTPQTKAHGHDKHRHNRIHTTHKSHAAQAMAPAYVPPQQTVEQQWQDQSTQQQQQPQPPAQQQPLSPPQYPAQQRPQSPPYPQQPSYSRPPPQWATNQEPPWAAEQRAKAEAKAAAFRQATYGRSMVQRQSRREQH